MQKWEELFGFTVPQAGDTVLCMHRVTGSMQIQVRVVPGARGAAVQPQADGTLKVRVDAPARDGRANGRLVEILARHFGVNRRAVRIVRGLAARDKVVEVDRETDR